MERKLVIAFSFFILIVSVISIFAFNGGFNNNENNASSKIQSSICISESSSSHFSSKSLSTKSSGIFSSYVAASNEGGNLTQVNPDVILNMDKILKLSNVKKGWGPGYGKNNSQPPVSLKTREFFKFYNAYCIGSSSTKKNYLTFDEGYENGYTAKILDTLKEKNVKAVFFVTKPYITANKALVKRMIDEGHVVGNHSAKHKSFPDMTTEEIKDDILMVHTLMQKEFNYDMFLFRYPNGEYSEQTLEITKELGYTSIFWSFAYKDYDTSNQLGTDYAYNKVISNAHNGAIYLLHAVSRDNAGALGNIIDTLRSKGYELALLDSVPE